MNKSPSIRKLFEDWQNGSGSAGSDMAQRFSDWYYAIAVSRLGEQVYREPVERACRRFAEGIPSVSHASVLVDWAHNIISEEMRSAGERLTRGDQPNQITNKQRPSELLEVAARQLPHEQISLLSHAYDRNYPIERVQAESESAGGYPLAVLEARYSLKRVLKAHGVKFNEVPESPNLDLAPLPLYEGGRMQSANEEAAFEKWVLSNTALCRDIAEFATFALALRSGALKLPAPTSKEPDVIKRSTAPEPGSTEKNGIPVPVYVIGVGVLLALLGAALTMLT